jgi:hypothetical protein
MIVPEYLDTEQVRNLDDSSQQLMYKCAVIGNSASPMEIYRDFANAPSDKWEFLN